MNNQDQITQRYQKISHIVICVIAQNAKQKCGYLKRRKERCYLRHALKRTFYWVAMTASKSTLKPMRKTLKKHIELIYKDCK